TACGAEARGSKRLGRHRRTVERTMAGLGGCRRLHHRYERMVKHFLAFLGFAAVLCCYKRLVRLTTNVPSA
ncbi:hypothetical protein ACWDA7_46955, partial [Streptomyces sp. NPDC001156]